MEDFSQRVRITHDAEVDAAYISLRSVQTGESRLRTVPVELPDGMPASILLDFDDEQRLVGIEILGAQAGLPQTLLTTPEAPEKES